MSKFKPFEPPDSHYLNAAEGWLGLGNPVEASAELERINPQLRVHPDVLRLQCEIAMRAEQWEAAFDSAQAMIQLAPERPEGWTNRSNALHFLKRYEQAYACLLPALATFPDQPHLRYNLACFCSRMNRLDEARKWLDQAFSMAGGKALRAVAMRDPDLEPLWKELAQP